MPFPHVIIGFIYQVPNESMKEIELIINLISHERERNYMFVCDLFTLFRLEHAADQNSSLPVPQVIVTLIPFISTCSQLNH
jgi:hypothetical protein